MLVTLTLTPDDFLHGHPCNPHGCPTYLALKRLTLPGLKVIVQPENALIIDPINPVMRTVRFPEELIRVIEQHDDYTICPTEVLKFQLDIPEEVLRDEAKEPIAEIVSEEEFAEAIRAAFKEAEVIGWDEPRDTRYGTKKAA